MPNKIHKAIVRYAAPALLAALIFGISPTIAFYNDQESAAGNGLRASALDMEVLGPGISASLLPGEATTTVFVVSKSDPANLDFSYAASSTVTGDAAACGYISVSASASSTFPAVPLKDFVLPANVAREPVEWNLTFAVPEEVPEDGLDKTCSFKISFLAWQTNLPGPAGGFSDMAEIENTIEIKKEVPAVLNVVLNEFLPNPGGFEYGFDFGADGDLMPQGEWVELYNNSDEKADLSGWYIWDNSGEAHHKVPLTAANTDLATTTIPSRGWLVVYMNHEILNNGEDTITLFDGAGAARDSYHYKGRDYLDLEPTPGDENATSTSGTASSSNVPSNKSYARIPDGIGEWVDPIPTPGGPNITPVFDMIPDIIATETATTTAETAAAEPLPQPEPEPAATEEPEPSEQI